MSFIMRFIIDFTVNASSISIPSSTLCESSILTRRNESFEIVPKKKKKRKRKRMLLARLFLDHCQLSWNLYLYVDLFHHKIQCAMISVEWKWEFENREIFLFLYISNLIKKKYENSIFASSCYIYTSWTKKSSELKKKLYFNLSILWQETN